MSNRINPGTFDSLITLQHQEKVLDSQGRISVSYRPCKRLFAHVSNKISDQAEDSYNMLSAQMISVETYHVPAVDNNWRIEYKDDTYEIVMVEPVDRSPFMRLNAVKLMTV